MICWISCEGMTTNTVSIPKLWYVLSCESYWGQNELVPEYEDDDDDLGRTMLRLLKCGKRTFGSLWTTKFQFKTILCFKQAHIPVSYKIDQVLDEHFGDEHMIPGYVGFIVEWSSVDVVVRGWAEQKVCYGIAENVRQVIISGTRSKLGRFGVCFTIILIALSHWTAIQIGLVHVSLWKI